jgi:hypothetical protein
MSVNLEVTVRKEGGEDAVLLLHGFSRGITHSAVVATGDTIYIPLSESYFDKMEVKVEEIHHQWQPAGSKRAPISTACGTATKPLFLNKDEFVYLLNLGFQEI